MPAGGLLTASAISAGAGFIEGSKRSKFRTPQIASLKDLSKEATQAQRQQLRGGIRNLEDFGGNFLQAQIQAQRQGVPGFFQQNQQQIGQGEDLIARLIGGDLERRLTTQSIRGAQAARGVTLSPASAIQEGLAVQRQQAANEFQAFGLRGQLAGLEAATPFGVEAFRPGIAGLDQLTQMGLSRSTNQAQLSAQGQMVKIQQADAARANNAAGFAALAGGFAGAGGAGGGAGGFEGFLQGSGVGPTQKQQRFPALNFNFGQQAQSQVSTTGGFMGPQLPG